MPNETNWQDITRRLDITPATQTDACNHKTRARGRAISKIPWTFTIPSITFTPNVIGSLRVGTLVAQFNYTAPSAFRILTPAIALQSSSTNLLVACVRYRVGTTVTRYQLRYQPKSSELDEQTRRLCRVFCALYDGDRIQPNFTIELWAGLVTAAGAATTTAEQVITTNILAIPDNADQLTDSFGISENLSRLDLDSAFPEALPTVYGDSSTWLTN